MPIFEYKCSKCSWEFSVLVFSSSAEKPKCPSCGSTEVDKKFSAFSCSGSAGGGAGTGGGST